MENRIKPTFLIVGVARCGTTSLYHYMKQHPEIGFSNQKEPKYFSSKNLSFPHNGIGDTTVDEKTIVDKSKYYSLFRNLEKFKVIGEASSDYLYYHKLTIPEIKKDLGDIPIIISIRNPIDRAHSAFNNLIRDGRENLNFTEALKEEEKRINNNWDWMWHYKKGSLYSNAIEDFQTNFSNVKIILFDDLEEKPQTILEEVFDFLNVSKDIQINTETKYSHSGKPKNKFVAILTDRNNKFFFNIRTIIIKTIPRSFLEKLASNLLKKDNLESNIKEDLLSFFESDILRLEKLINRNLDKWRKL